MYNLRGQKFGRLVVVEKAGRTKTFNILWKCLCDCGSYTTAISSRLVGGTKQSCGCLQKEAASKMGKSLALPDGEAAFNALFEHSYKKDARRCHRKFALTKNQFRLLTSENCYYCGAKPAQIARTANNTGYYKHNGIDRINSSKGYIMSNITALAHKS